MVRAVASFARFELELFFQTLIAVFFTYLMPCAFYAAVVRATAKNDPAGAAGAYLPLFIGLMIVFISLYTLATQVVINREAGFYKRLLVTNLNPVGIAISNTIRGYALIVIGMILLIGETVAMFHVFPRLHLFQGLLATALAGATMFFFGMIPACFVKRSNSMFTLSSILSYVLMFFSGVRPPLGGFERVAHYVDFISPGYYALGVLRAGFAGELFRISVLPSLAALAVIIAISVAVIRRYFTWM